MSDVLYSYINSSVTKGKEVFLLKYYDAGFNAGLGPKHAVDRFPACCAVCAASRNTNQHDAIYVWRQEHASKGAMALLAND